MIFLIFFSLINYDFIWKTTVKVFVVSFNVKVRGWEQPPFDESHSIFIRIILHLEVNIVCILCVCM